MAAFMRPESYSLKEMGHNWQKTKKKKIKWRITERKEERKDERKEKVSHDLGKGEPS